MEPDPIDALDSPPEVKARLRAIRDRIAREEPEALIDEAEERALARGPARRGPRPIPVAPAEPAEPCGVAGCARTVRAAGLCVGHYERRALGRDPTEARCRRCRATFAAPELPAPRSCPACRRPARNFGPMPFGLDPARPAEAEVARRIFRYLIRWPMGRTLEMLAAEGATTRGGGPFVRSALAWIVWSDRYRPLVGAIVVNKARQALRRRDKRPCASGPPVPK